MVTGVVDGRCCSCWLRLENQTRSVSGRRRIGRFIGEPFAPSRISTGTRGFGDTTEILVHLARVAHPWGLWTRMRWSLHHVQKRICVYARAAAENDYRLVHHSCTKQYVRYNRSLRHARELCLLSLHHGRRVAEPSDDDDDDDDRTPGLWNVSVSISGHFLGKKKK